MIRKIDGDDSDEGEEKGSEVIGETFWPVAPQPASSSSSQEPKMRAAGIPLSKTLRY